MSRHHSAASQLRDIDPRKLRARAPRRFVQGDGKARDEDRRVYLFRYVPGRLDASAVQKIRSRFDQDMLAEMEHQSALEMIRRLEAARERPTDSEVLAMIEAGRRRTSSTPMKGK